MRYNHEPCVDCSDPFSGTDLRMNMGLYYTPEEWKKKRRQILYKPLPGANLLERMASKVRYYIAVLRDE